jgi:hypothetical protein
VSTLLVLLTMPMTVTGWAHAEPDDAAVERASTLYEKGRQAHDRGAHQEAARAFAAADALVPDSAALEAALVSVLKTDEAPLGMDLATRAGREPGNAKLAGLAERARKKFEGEVGRIVVSCEACVVLVDAVPTKRGASTWVRIGKHQVVIRQGEAKEQRTVFVEPGAVVTLLPLAPSARPSPSPSPDGQPETKKQKRKRKKKRPERAGPGPSPTWFWIAFAATAAVGVGAVISAVDTASKHASFSDEPTEERAVEGEAAQMRTNVLLGVTGGLAVVTLAVGLFVVDWDRDDVALTPGGVRIRF